MFRTSLSHRPGIRYKRMMHLRRPHMVVPPALRSPWVIWGAAAGFYVIAMFHRMSLAVASLRASERLDVPVETIALLSALQLLLYLALIVPAGLMVDRVGPRRTLAIGLLAMGLGQASFGVAHDAVPALAARGVIGAGDALIFLCVLRLAQSWFPPRRYAPLALLTAGAGAVGQLATTVPLGGALDILGWTPVFLGSGLATLAAAGLCLVVVRDRPAGAGTPEAAPLAGTRVALRAAWARAGTRHAFWTHLTLMGPFVAVTALWGYPYMVDGRGLTEAAARMTLLACVALCALASPAFGVIVARRPGLRDVVTLGTATVVGALWSITLLWPGGAPVALVVTTMIATGPACAAAMLAFDIARADTPPERAGIATGLANTGGFSAAVAIQVLVAALVGAGGLDMTQAMLPVPATLALGVVQMTRHARRAGRVASSRRSHAVSAPSHP
jgi:MFS family permease